MRSGERAADRGAILIHAAIGMVAMMALATFVIDYGVFVAARRQAQNAADAGALAGVTAFVFDSQDKSPTGPARESALQTALAHGVWGQSPSVLPDDADFVTCPPGTVGIECFRVDVYRNADRGNPLPMLIGPIIGLTQQNVRATATARVAAANGTDCMKPFAVPDFYSPTLDDYVAPGYTLGTHLGTEVLLKGGPGTQMEPGWFQLLGLNVGSGGGSPEVWHSIKTCSADPFYAGDDLTEYLQSGNMASIQGHLEDVWNLDPFATFNSTTGAIDGGCSVDRTCQRYQASTGSNWVLVDDPGRWYSPRIFPLPVFDPVKYFATGEVEIVNILGFFLDEVIPDPPNFNIRGRLISQPGLLDLEGGGTIPANAAFIKVIQLIR